MDRQKPDAQRQLGRHEDRAAEQRCLMSAGAALVVRLPAATESQAPSLSTAGAAEALRPLQPAQGAVGLRFHPIPLHELGHRPALLELDQVYRHGCVLNKTSTPRPTLVADHAATS